MWERSIIQRQSMAVTGYEWEGFREGKLIVVPSSHVVREGKPLGVKGLRIPLKSEKFISALILIQRYLADQSDTSCTTRASSNIP
jgi:hypothetical protein